jgi:DNA-binding MarR family transcriptional regulator
MANPKVAEKVEGCVLSRLRKVTRRVTQMYDRTLEPAGLTITQFGLLSHLNAYGDMTIGELATRMVMDATTLTRLLRPLERDGYIAIVANPDDRRRRDITLTAAGKAATRKAAPLWKEAQDELQGILGSADFLVLQKALGVSLDHLLRA